ncbi:diaminopimelate epimerase [Salinimicrobium catena]|uniref:Diaminopimelate epimerase n=1 Tax=Salinimicrobium catena TaxID=390640 RepID=A0A1H5KYX6_9FLAO|nr:diaminopimelate epimerase [Salinimicrobium catena]SDL03525.1 diaminopimelate epimerase [Salinimicrobium catena]SEE69923.1 diaminopimelate epimerase [Salinimicrobium catena]
MELSFYKYQGTGNDFVMVDNRQNIISKNNTNLIKTLCDRKFGIGADGLILLEDADEPRVDFKMVYFNSDGRESSMCGNGGRCIVAFAHFLGIIKDRTVFTAIDGLHEATIEGDLVSLKMTEVERVEEKEDAVFLNTGSPHHVVFHKDIASLNIKEEGAAIRYSEAYKKAGGTNVNFSQPSEEAVLRVRTYERGVEDETLSCGTGVTAVALAAFATGKVSAKKIKLLTPGGELFVSFEPEGKAFKNIWLTGPAKQVFKGEISC